MQQLDVNRYQIKLGDVLILINRVEVLELVDGSPITVVRWQAYVGVTAAVSDTPQAAVQALVPDLREIAGALE